MGTDKAFLFLEGRTFISIIVNEMLRVSDDVVIAIGNKNSERLIKEISDKRVRFVNDFPNAGTPLGGMLAGFEVAASKYAAVVACDLPLVRRDVIDGPFAAAEGHDGTVPLWNPEDKFSMEPLCAVYNVQSMIKAIKRSLANGANGCKQAVMSLADVSYVPVSELKQYDPGLGSFRNINTKTDYSQLLKDPPSSKSGSVSHSRRS